jgi:hypothetical protein
LGFTLCLGITNNHDSVSDDSGFLREAVAEAATAANFAAAIKFCLAAAAAIGLMEPLELDEPPLLPTHGSWDEK